MLKQNHLQKQIMRRVYISYGLSYVEQPLLWFGLVLGGALALLGRWTHISSIIDNTLSTPVGQVPTYITESFMSAIARGELGTVIVILTIASISAFVLWQFARIRISTTLRVA
jgi:hypothetical protein